MTKRILGRLRPGAIAYMLVGMLVAGAGSYALAASRAKSNTITVCVGKKTGIMRLKTHKRCRHGARRMTWNQRGPAGPAGVKGAAGAPGAPGAAGTSAVNNWAVVANAGTVLYGQNVAVTHVAAGTYQVTITGACADRPNAPTVTVTDGNPPGGIATPQAFPVAWDTASGTNQFTVYTGLVASGLFTATDHTFTVMDTCD